MNAFRITTVLLVAAASSFAADAQWRTIDEGFRFTIPPDWKKIEVRGIDSHVGEYRGATACLRFDEIFGLGYTVENSDAFIEQLKKKEREPSTLKEGEEIWHVDGRIALFFIGKADPKIYGKPAFQNVAKLSLSYPGEAGGLGVTVFFATDGDVPTVRKILRSLVWSKKEPNQSPQPTR